MKTPSERFQDLMQSIGPEQIAEIEKRMEELKTSPREVSWREDPDPFGQDWAWVEGAKSSQQAMTSPRVDPVITTIPWRRRLLWASGIAASLAALAFGAWAALPRKLAIREQSLAAWVAHKLVPNGGGLSLTAAPEDEDSDRSPMTTGVDRPLDAKPPAQPNIYAPIRIQEQLVIPTLSDPVTKGVARPVPTVTEKARSGALFYLEFSSAGARGEGSAVAIRVGPGFAEVLAQEVPFGASDVTSYLGPLKMADVENSYLVIIADRRSVSLLDTVAATLPRGNSSPEDGAAWRFELAAALMKAGHEWYGLQRIIVQPEAAPVPPR
jgi:hypothetical protein